MRKLTWLIVLMIAFTFVSVKADVTSEKEWTLLLFINGDNNLSSAGKEDINEMEKIGSTDDVNIIVEFDSAGSNGTWRYYIEKDDNSSSITSPVVQDLGEQDTGDWQHALDFFKWGVDNYPAQKYLIAFWNHGAGWEKDPNENVLTKGICYDDQSGNHITTPQLSMLTKALYEHAGRKIDIISYDACLMQMMEVGYETRQYCDIQVGAEETEPGDGWPYDDFLAPLVANPTMNPVELSKTMVKAYGDSYMGGSQGTSATTQSAIDLRKIEWFRNKVDTLAETLIEKAPSYTGAYQTAINQTQKYAYSQCKDLGHFCENLIKEVNDYSVKSAAQDVLDSLPEFVIEYVNTGSKVENSHGVSIYIPSKYQFDGKKDDYAAIKWAQDSKWDEFLSGLFYPNYPVIKLDTITYKDSDGDGKVSPGERVDFEVKIKNEGNKPSSSLQVKLAVDGWDASVNSSYASVFGVDALSETTVDGLSATISSSCDENKSIDFVISVEGEGINLSKTETLIVRKPFAVRNNVLLLALDSEKNEYKEYMTALNDCGIKFDLWDNKIEEGQIPYSLLAKYVNGVVIVPAPGTSDLNVVGLEDLQSYLDAGGNLFISGQDIGYKLKDDDFYSQYLHAKYIQDNVGIHNVVGENGFNMEFAIEGGDGANNQKWPDEIEAIGNAQVIFKYSGIKMLFKESKDTGFGSKSISGAGHAGIFAQEDNYKVVYFSFGFEAIDSREARKSVMEAVMDLVYPTLRGRLQNMVIFEERMANATDENALRRLITKRNNGEEALFDMVKDNPQLLNEYSLDRHVFGDVMNRVIEYKMTAEDEDDDLDDLIPLGKPDKKK